MQSTDMQKSNKKHLEDALAMIFIDFGLLRIAHTAKYLTYLLTSRYVLKFDNLHMTQCAKIIVGFMATVGNVFIKRLQTFFLIFFPTFLRFFDVYFLNFYLNVH